jgi:hypothetical protein
MVIVFAELCENFSIILWRINAFTTTSIKDGLNTLSKLLMGLFPLVREFSALVNKFRKKFKIVFKQSSTTQAETGKGYWQKNSSF